jgi:hypothetical protein
MQATQGRRTTAIQKSAQHPPKPEHNTLTKAEATFLERGYYVPDEEAMANLLDDLGRYFGVKVPYIELPNDRRRMNWLTRHWEGQDRRRPS